MSITAYLNDLALNMAEIKDEILQLGVFASNIFEDEKLETLSSSLAITQWTIDTDLLAYDNLPKSEAEYLKIDTSAQQALNKLLADKELYENSHSSIEQLIKTVDEFGLDAIKETLVDLEMSLQQYSLIANDLLASLLSVPEAAPKKPAATTKPKESGEYDPKNPPTWNGSIGTNNVCGFASFVLPLHQAMLSDPAVFYKDGIVPESARRFFATYLRELGNINIEQLRQRTEKHAGNTIALQRDGCAAALKRAFAQTMLNDHSELSPFHSILGIVIGGYLAPDEAVEDYADYTKAFLDKHTATLHKAHKAYKLNVDREVDTDLTVPEANKKIALKTCRYTDGARFLDFLEATEGALINSARQNYCAGLMITDDSYMTRELDAIYIATQIGFRDTIIDNNIGRVGYFSQPTNPNGRVDITLRHRPDHWESAPLVLPAKAEPKNKPATKPTAAPFTPAVEKATSPPPMTPAFNAAEWKRRSKLADEKEAERIRKLSEAASEAAKSPGSAAATESKKPAAEPTEEEKKAARLAKAREAMSNKYKLKT